MLKIVNIAMVTMMTTLEIVFPVTKETPKTNNIDRRPMKKIFALDGGLSVVVVVAIITSVMVLTGGGKRRRF